LSDGSDEEEILKSGDIKHDAEDATNSKKTKKKKCSKCSPGTLYELSQACCKTARRVASTGLFVSVYDNINLMFRVAEQILGRTSKRQKLSNYK
jgi:hypothetical protein